MIEGACILDMISSIYALFIYGVTLFFIPLARNMVYLRTYWILLFLFVLQHIKSKEDARRKPYR